jgi:hypothetical protein
MADLAAEAFPLDALLEQAEKDKAAGLEDLPYPPNYPKMPGEPKRVQPSRDRDRPRPDPGARPDPGGPG